MLHDEAEAHGYHDPNDNLLRNSAQHATQDDVEEGDGDDGLDDDMNDKISSSPSIGDDGGYPIPSLPWPHRVASLRSVSSPEKKATHSPGPPSDVSSSPFSETPEHFPLSFPHSKQRGTPSKDHHQKGRYTEVLRSSLVVDEYESKRRDQLGPLVWEQHKRHPEEEFMIRKDSYEDVLDPLDFAHLLAPEDDPLLHNSFNDEALDIEDAETPSDTSSSPSKASWDPEVLEEYDDDTKDILFDVDSRFVDSGWGGECLREIEDIDFEFVYALHTFVATVEGQANATKGDTMVLLDDSNSYWWLVRVVKDGSIGGTDSTCRQCYLVADQIRLSSRRAH